MELEHQLSQTIFKIPIYPQHLGPNLHTVMDLANLEVSLDKLPIKRLEVIEENGLERFPSDVGYDEKSVNLIRRIDFGWAVERAEEEEDRKKQKTKSTTDNAPSTTPPSSSGGSVNKDTWQWKTIVENLHLGLQELTVIIELINTVGANDAVTVAGMTRPKQLPNELLSDIAVSSATKLQCFRHLGKYFKQSAKALDKQVAREARFYGALIRLQQNWKVKRHRMVASASGNEGFYIDLFDNSLYDPAVALRPSSVSTVRIEHDSAGMLAVNLPRNSYRSLKFEFLGSCTTRKGRNLEIKQERSAMDSSMECDEEHISDVEYIRETHSVIRRVHQAIFDEQVFDLVNGGAFNPSPGVYVTGIQENYLRLSIGEVASLSISLVPSDKDGDIVESTDIEGLDAPLVSIKPSNISNSGEKYEEKITGFPSGHCFEIYLQQIFHEHVFVKAKSRSGSIGKAQSASPPVKENLNLLGHFCMSLAHRIFSNKVLSVLEDLVDRTPYVQLSSHPTWHSRTSSWSLSMKVPQSILNHEGQHDTPGIHHMIDVKYLFRTMVMVNDDCISVEGEGSPNIVGLFKGKSESTNPMNRYDCDSADLPVILLQQVGSHIIRWLHEEALVVGIKTNRDFLSLSFEMDQGESLALVAHVGPDNPKGCISWWLVMEDRLREDQGSQAKISTFESQTRKYLGFLPLEVLYSTVMDLASLCSSYGIH